MRKHFDKVTEARRAARERGAKPGAVRVIQDKRHKPPKHKGKVYDD